MIDNKLFIFKFSQGLSLIYHQTELIIKWKELPINNSLLINNSCSEPASLNLSKPELILERSFNLTTPIPIPITSNPSPLTCVKTKSIWCWQKVLTNSRIRWISAWWTHSVRFAVSSSRRRKNPWSTSQRNSAKISSHIKPVSTKKRPIRCWAQSTKRTNKPK